MCLIAIAWQGHPRYRLALIANRDEFHARAAAPAGPDPVRGDVYGGRDLAHGGSWLLVSTRGRLAAVTNVRAGPAPETAPRSRGSLVREFVQGDATGAEWLGSLQPHAHEFGRFNLIAWDGASLMFASNHPHFTIAAIAPGLHAMSNGAFDAPWPKSTHATQALSEWLKRSGDSKVEDGTRLIEPLLDALADTTTAPDAALPDTGVGLELERTLSPPFVRGEHYGTRCSTVVLVDAESIMFAERRYGPLARRLGESLATLPIAAGAAGSRI